MSSKIDCYMSLLANELKCPICHLILKDPIQISVCNHLFCVDCIDEWLSRDRTNKVCPLCCVPISSDNKQQVNRVLAKIVENMLVKCENYKRGCKMWIEASNFNQHLEVCAHRAIGETLPKVSCSNQHDEEPLPVATSQNEIEELLSQIENLELKVSEKEAEINDRDSEIEALLHQIEIAFIANEDALKNHKEDLDKCMAMIVCMKEDINPNAKIV